MEFILNALKQLLPGLDYAIMSKDKWLFKKLLHLNMNLDTVSPSGLPLLQLAFIEQRNDFAFELLEYGANPNIAGIDVNEPMNN